MVTIKIPQGDGTVKQYGSLPITFGLQKAFSRYSITQAQLVEEARRADATPFDPTQENKYNKLVDSINEHAAEKTALIIRAFGNQFTVDELDEADADDIDRVIAQLQLEANGIARKNG